MTGAVPGHNVTFLDSTGVLIADVAADAEGKAQADMPEGGTVALLSMDPQPRLHCSGQITTAVKRGDHLTFARAPARGNQATMTAWFTPVVDAQTDVYTPCGPTSVRSTQPGTTLTFFDDCHGPTFDLLMVVQGGPLASPMFTVMPAIEYRDGGAFQLTGTSTAMESFTIGFHGIPPQLGGIFVKHSTVRDGAIYGSMSTLIAPTSADQEAVVPYAQGFGAGNEVVALWSGAEMAVVKPGLDSTIDIDVGASQLPVTTDTSWSTTGLSWTTDGLGRMPDAVAVLWQADYNEAAEPVSMAYQVLGPWSDHVSIPRLPEQYAACDPNQHDDVVLPFDTTSTFVGVDYDTIDGYDEFRQQPADLLDDLGTIRRFTGQEVHRSLILGSVTLDSPGDFHAPI